MTEALFSIREVANHLGVRWYRIKYAHMAGLVPEPRRVANNRLYCDADVKRLKHYFLKKGGNAINQCEKQRL